MYKQPGCSFVESPIKMFISANEQKRKELVSWCFGVAYADGVLHPKEDILLKNICRKLKVDYDGFIILFRKE